MSQSSQAEAYVVNRLLAADIILEDAHAVLDARGVPRTSGGQTVPLSVRIRALIGETHLDPLLASAPMPSQIPRPGDIESVDLEAEEETEAYIPRDAHYRRVSIEPGADES